MLRYINYAFYAALVIVLVLVALANRGTTELRLLPNELSFFGLNLSIELPVFVVFFGGVVFGVLIGFCWEWLREHKYRAEVSRKSRALRRTERELAKIKGEKYAGQDDVLSLLDEAG